MAAVMAPPGCTLLASAPTAAARPTLAWAPPASDENSPPNEEFVVGNKVVFVGDVNIARQLELTVEAFRYGEVESIENDLVKVLFGHGKDAWVSRRHVQKLQAPSPRKCRGGVHNTRSTPSPCGGSKQSCDTVTGATDSSPSMLSRYLASHRTLASPEDRADASLVDVIDSAARSMHQGSQKHKPSVPALLDGLSATDRQETLVWLVQAFDVMNFSDSLLFDTALLLDRYYAVLPREDLRNCGRQRKLLAAVCMALKTGAPVDTQLTLRDLIKHLGRDSVPFDDVLQAELVMLRKLRFHTGTPTARDFLEALSTRLKNERVSGACWSLSEFLLQLTLVDAPLHYRFPHAVLAGATIALALHSLRAPAASYTALLEDLALHCPEALAQHSQMLMQCVHAVHAHWVRCMTAGHEQNGYARHLCSKFTRVAHFAVGAMDPTPTPPTSLPPAQGWTTPTATTPPSATQDETDEAIAVVRQSLLMDQNSADPRVRHSSRCPRCGRMWSHLADAHHHCMECGYVSDAAEDIHWATSLAARLRGPAEASWKVRAALARHSWVNGRFRRAPDRELLLRDLQRQANQRPMCAAPIVHNGSASGRSSSGVTLGAAADKVREHRVSSGSGTGVSADLHQQRRRRAASWAGMRSLSAVAAAAAAAGGGTTMCCNAPTRAQASATRSPS